jgi:hypothetical protein
MKKFVLGLGLAVSAIALGFAFSKPHTSATAYYFQVTSTTAPGNETSATLNFPASLPPTTPSGFTCPTGTTHDCLLAFPGYYIDANLDYEPALTPNASAPIPQSSYNTFTERVEKD